MADSTNKDIWIGRKHYPKGTKMPAGFDEKISKAKEKLKGKKSAPVQNYKQDKKD